MMTLDHLIAAHITAHGVTRCPAAIVAPSTAELSRADVEAHLARPPIVLRDVATNDPRKWRPRRERVQS